MGVSIPSSSIRQPRELGGADNQGNKSNRIQYKDPDGAALEAAVRSFEKGDVVESGWMLDSWMLEKLPGGGGLLTLNCIADDGTGSDVVSGGTALRVVWACKSVRNDMSILSYCGGAASRINLELWMKETDAAVADANSFHATETTTDSLNSQEIAIANKIRKGIDTVIRFYPVLTCKSTWSRIPGGFLRQLGYVDTPSAPSAIQTFAPGNLRTVISAYSWLKVQDDVDETNGRFQRVESWMGIDGTWDADLYGPNRWPMPLQSASS